MIRHVLLFLGAFATGALIALVARAALHRPSTGHEMHAAPGGEYAAQVANTPPTVPGSAASRPAQPAGSPAVPPVAEAGRPVNTVCAICGMDVDPKLPTVQYQGKTVGFGCRMCPPKFKADPERYGPYYLRNEVIPR